jgi:hypothetical protein
MEYRMPKFTVVILLSHCAGGTSTASGDIDIIDSFNLCLPHHGEFHCKVLDTGDSASVAFARAGSYG